LPDESPNHEWTSLVSVKLLILVFGIGVLLLLISVWSGQIREVMLTGAWGGAEALVVGSWYGVIVFLLGCAIILIAAGMAIASARRHGPASLFCMQCGAENPATDEFCEKCGKKLAPMT
jgi:ribosomal protein L40E